MDASADLDDTLCMTTAPNRPSTDSQPDSSLQRLANDAMQRDFPENFSSREAWDAYNEKCDRRFRSRAHLKGIGLDLSDTNNLPF